MISQLAFWGTAAVIALLIVRKGRVARDWELVVGAVLPALLLLLCFSGNPGFGDFRLRVEAVEIERDALAIPLRVGGEPEADDIVFQGLPPRAAELRRHAGGAPRWILGVGVGGPADKLSVAELRLRNGERWIVGSEALRAGDVVCLERCGSGGALSLRLNADETALERLDGGGALPEFRSHPYAWSGRFWGPQQAIYPLRDYGVPWRGVGPNPSEPCRGRFLCRTGEEPVRSFLYRACAGSGCIRILLLDPDARIVRDGRETHRARGAAVPLDGSGVERIVFYTTAFGSSYANLLDDSRPASRLVSRGAVDPSSAGRVVRLGLPDSRTIPISRAAIDEAALAGETLTLTVVGAGRMGSESVANPLSVGEIGGETGRMLGHGIRFDASDAFGRTARAFALTPGQSPVLLDTSFVAGSVEPRRGAQLRLERLDRPFALTSIMPILWGWLLLAASYRTWRENRLAFLLVLVMQWLLAVRLLIGSESAVLDPELAFGAAIGGNIAAYVALPLALAAATPGSDRSRAELWPSILFAAAVTGICAWTWGASASLYVATLAVVAAAAVAAAGLIRCSAPAPAPAADGREGQGRERTSLADFRRAAALGKAAASYVRGLFAENWWAWPVLIVLLAAMRLVLLAFGIRERFSWPDRFAVSIVYLPALLFAFGGFFSAVLHARTPTWRAILAYWGALAFALGVVPYLVGDTGLFIYVIPVVVLAYAVTRARTGRRGGWSALGWNAVPLGATLLLASMLIYGKLDGRSWEAEVAAVAEEVRAAASPEAAAPAHSRAAALLGDASSDDRNALRVWTALAPERVARSGTSDAESQRRVSAILSDYTTTLAGRGYMAPSDPADIRPYQADDNLSAVHIMSPFGRVGAAMLVIMLGLLGWRASSLLARKDVPTLAGLLAVWTVFATAAYMVLANLQLVPFTGRNIYLLAGLSASDLVEGLVLFIMAARGLREEG